MTMSTGRVATYRRDRGLQFRMGLTMFLFVALYVGFGLVLWRFGGLQWYFIVPIIGLMSFLQWWYSDRIILAASRATKVTEQQYPKLHAMVDRLARRVAIKKPTIAVIDNPISNAFATGRSKNNAVVAVTTGIMKQLDDDELEAVLGHEIGHVINSDMTIMAFANFLIAATSFLMTVFFWSSLFRGGGRGSGNSGAVLMLLYGVTLVVYIVGQMLVMAISRTREHVADHTGAELTGQPKKLASALQKISRPLEAHKKSAKQLETARALCIIPSFAGGFGGLFSTHPPVEERVRRLNALAESQKNKATFRYKYIKYDTYSWDKS